jgi:hypothetical protein
MPKSGQARRIADFCGNRQTPAAGPRSRRSRRKQIAGSSLFPESEQVGRKPRFSAGDPALKVYF